MELIPAILENDYTSVVERLSQVTGLVETVQIDVCDGKLVPSLTWPYRKQDDNFESIVSEDTPMPYWNELDFEIDLMVADPASAIDHWISAGASRLIVHFESFNTNSSADQTSLTTFISKYRERFPKSEYPNAFNPETGLAIGTDVTLDQIKPYIEQFDSIQFMGINKIGFQGQEFNVGIIDKIKQFKGLYPNIPVSVDGGVRLDKVALLKQAGVDRIIVGSAIFATDNANQTIYEFTQAIKRT